MKKIIKNLFVVLTLIGMLFTYSPGVVSATSNHTVDHSSLRTEIYDTTGAGTWVAPSGVTSVVVETYGAGGYGGSSNGMGSGGGGGYGRKTISVTPGNTYNLSVGVGGGGPGSTGDSWFINNTTVKGGGGANVTTSTIIGGNGGTGIGDVTYNGGNGGNNYYDGNPGQGYGGLGGTARGGFATSGGGGGAGNGTSGGSGGGVGGGWSAVTGGGAYLGYGGANSIYNANWLYGAGTWGGGSSPWGGPIGQGAVYITYTLATAPTVTTQAVSSIYSTIAIGNGNVTADGGATITERGTVISTSTNPTTSDHKDTASGTTGAFTTSITALNPNTLYHVRAYAINSSGTSYGSDVSFTTYSGPNFFSFFNF